MTNSNQYAFEIARDVATMLLSMKPGESVNITIQASLQKLFDVSADRSLPCGPSEAAVAMRTAYETVFGES